MKILSSLLIIVTIYLNFKHGWAGISNNLKPAELEIMSSIGLNDTAIKCISILCLVVCVLILFPPTFFVSNVLYAISILLIMAFALRSGNYKIAVMELPFFAMPLLLIYLGHPFKK
jgi:hypothetical protein